MTTEQITHEAEPSEGGLRLDNRLRLRLDDRLRRATEEAERAAEAASEAEAVAERACREAAEAEAEREEAERAHREWARFQAAEGAVAKATALAMKISDLTDHVTVDINTRAQDRLGAECASKARELADTIEREFCFG